jgi:hypothetical protein
MALKKSEHSLLSFAVGGFGAKSGRRNLGVDPRRGEDLQKKPFAGLAVVPKI